MTELRLALRSLGRARVFTAVVVVSLALGIGANGAMFGLADQVLLRLLPVHRTRASWCCSASTAGASGRRAGDGVTTFSHPLYLALRDRNTVLSRPDRRAGQPASLVGDDRSESISVGLVAGNFFDVLGVRPHRGRLLVPDDDRVQERRARWRSCSTTSGSNRFAGERRHRGLDDPPERHRRSRWSASPIARFEGTDTGLPTKRGCP